MEFMGRAMDIATRALNSNAAINTVLVGAFGLLSMRSMHQQQQIETLESEKESLIKSNKAVKKAIWESKLKLYADAETCGVSLSTLQSIYGDVPTATVPSGGGIPSLPLGRPCSIWLQMLVKRKERPQHLKF